MSPDKQMPLPLRLEAGAVERIDDWRARGMKSRMEFFRRALGHYLAHIGAGEAAALFASRFRERATELPRPDTDGRFSN